MRYNLRRSNTDRQPLALRILPLLENPPRHIAMDIQILGRGRRICIWLRVVARAAQHGQNDGEGLLRVVEGDVENGTGVDEGVYGCVVVGAFNVGKVR